MTAPYYEDDRVTILAGDCLDILRELPDASVDAVVTDPPYSLSFMGREWDSHETPAGFQAWCLEWTAECLRVLKPGGHLLAFGGTRTWHRLACAVEDAGFEVRDSIAWLYGSGFPKSLDVSKAIDKAAGAEREVVGSYKVPSDSAAGNAGKVIRSTTAASSLYGVGTGLTEGRDITAPATDDARTWQGWGTALKPAFEPIVVARKPLVGTVAGNVLAHGTGALNIDGCRIGTEPVFIKGGGAKYDAEGNETFLPSAEVNEWRSGRWPANVVLDESQAAELDQQSGELHAPGTNGRSGVIGVVELGLGSSPQTPGRTDSGGASRFFYVAKADAGERVRVNGTAHPTVKPLALMRWLVRLVTPPGGTVLEPFAGSGTTIEACILEGFRCIAIEREADYLPLIMQRINRRRDPVAAVLAADPDDGGLFDLLDGESA